MSNPCAHILKIGNTEIRLNGSAEFKAFMSDYGFQKLLEDGVLPPSFLDGINKKGYQVNFNENSKMYEINDPYGKEVGNVYDDFDAAMKAKNALDFSLESPGMTRVTHEHMNEVAKKMGFEIYKSTPQTFEEWNKEADSLLQSDKYILGKVISKLAGQELLSPAEQIIAERYYAGLQDQYRKNQSNELFEKIRSFNHLQSVYNSAWGRAGRTIQIWRPVEDTLADFHLREAEEAGVNVLTEEQKAQATKDYEEIQKLRKEYEDKFEQQRGDYENKIAELNLELERERQKKKNKGSKRTVEDIKRERNDLKDQLKQAVEEHKKWMDENGIQNAGFAANIFMTPKMAKIIGKIIGNYAEEAAFTLEEVVKKVYDEIKSIAPNLNERDIRDVLAGKYAESKVQQKQEKMARVYEWKREQKLIDKYIALEEGYAEGPKTAKLEKEKNRAVKELEDKIGRHPVEVLRKKKESLRKSISKAEADIERLIKGEEAETEKPKPPFKPDKELIELQDKYIMRKVQREERLMEEKLKARSKPRKYADAITNVLDTFREIMSNPDMSFIGRQGTIFLWNHPEKAVKNWLAQRRFMLMEKKYHQWFENLHNNHEVWNLIVNSRLAVIDPVELRLSKREEQWRATMIQKVPLLGQVFKASERAFTSGANMARVEWFMSGVEMLKNKGITWENNPEEYRSWAKAVNNLTGRGSLGFLEKIAPELAIPFWSPRLMAARLNMFNPWFYYKLKPEARKMYAYEIGHYIMNATIFLGIAKVLGSAMGIDVELNPESSDFAKIKIGKTRYDMFGGYGQYIRAFYQMGSGKKKSTTTGEITELKPMKRWGTTPGTILRGKLSPVFGRTYDFLSGEDLNGNPVDWKDWRDWGASIVPLIFKDILDASKEQDPGGVAFSGLASFLGVGVQTYTDRPSEAKRPAGVPVLGKKPGIPKKKKALISQ